MTTRTACPSAVSTSMQDTAACTHLVYPGSSHSSLSRSHSCTSQPCPQNTLCSKTPLQTTSSSPPDALQICVGSSHSSTFALSHLRCVPVSPVPKAPGVLVRPYLQKMYPAVAQLYSLAYLLKAPVYRFAHHHATVFCRAHNVVDKVRLMVRPVQILAFPHPTAANKELPGTDFHERVCSAGFHTVAVHFHFACCCCRFSKRMLSAHSRLRA